MICAHYPPPLTLVAMITSSDRVGITSWIDALAETGSALDLRDLCRRCILGGFSYSDLLLFSIYASTYNLLDCVDLDTLRFVARDPECGYHD